MIVIAVITFYPSNPQACVSLQQVYRYKEWRRLFLSPLHHVDDWHLYFNMVSFIWKGIRLERRLGGGWFLYLLSVFSLLYGLMYLLLQVLLTKLTVDSNPLVNLIDVSSLSRECAVGFSGTNYQQLHRFKKLQKAFYFCSFKTKLQMWKK